MCGRVVQASDPLRFAFVDGLDLPDSRAKPPSYSVAPSLRNPRKPRDRPTHSRTSALRPDPARLQGPRGRAQADQRACRIRRAASNLSRRLCQAPLHRARRLFLRVAGDQGGTGEATLRRRDEGPLALHHRRALGELASPAKRRMDSHGGDHHRAVERVGRANPRSHAVDPAEGRLRTLAKWRARSPRSTRAVPGGTHGDVAGLDAGQQAVKRRCLAA